MTGDVAAVCQLRGMAYREERQPKRNERDVDRVILCGVSDDSPLHDWKTHAIGVRRDGVVEYVRDGVVGVRDEGDLVHINPAYYGGDRSNFALAMAITSHKSGDRVAFQGEIAFMKDALRSLQDFNREYELSRFEPTREDQQRYLDYLEEVERSQPKVDRQVAAAHVPPDPAPLQDPRP